MRLSTHSGTSNGRAAADEVRGGGGAGAVHAVPECGGLDQGHGRRWADELAPRIVMPSSATWHSQRRWCGATQAQVVCMWVSVLEDEGSLGKQCAAFQALMGGLSSSGLCGTAGKFKATDKAEWEKGSAGDPRTTFALKKFKILKTSQKWLATKFWPSGVQPQPRPPRSPRSPYSPLTKHFADEAESQDVALYANLD
ncbi:hypothetical protein C8J57DRAFT_1557262 [Mycena rebaudengoi]|nr:hypothetical protein C8J57DRAFT_1557262 [Mycena rebaudengoi]